MSECGDVCVVAQLSAFERPVGNSLSHRGSKHCTDVDSHIEEAECRVTFGRVLRIVVEVTYHYLEVAFEQTGTDSNKCQSTKHQNFTHQVCLGGNRQAEVAGEHYADTQGYAFTIAKFVGQDTAEEGHEVNAGKEDRVDLGCLCSSEAEFCLNEQQENRQHCVVAKALTGVGKGQSIQSFRLSFEHRN